MKRHISNSAAHPSCTPSCIGYEFLPGELSFPFQTTQHLRILLLVPRSFEEINSLKDIRGRNDVVCLHENEEDDTEWLRPYEVCEGVVFTHDCPHGREHYMWDWVSHISYLVVQLHNFLHRPLLWLCTEEVIQFQYKSARMSNLWRK